MIGIIIFIPVPVRHRVIMPDADFTIPVMKNISYCIIKSGGFIKGDVFERGFVVNYISCKIERNSPEHLLFNSEKTRINQGFQQEHIRLDQT